MLSDDIARAANREHVYVRAVKKTNRPGKTYIPYIPLTLDPRQGSRGISDIRPRRHVLSK
jgi:hypothetical protein